MALLREGVEPGSRYSGLSQILHWMIVLLVAGQLLFVYFVLLHSKGPKHWDQLGVHLSIGMTILFLALGRLIWRLFNPAPPMPASYPLWNKVLAKTTHWGLYVFLIAMPLSGWWRASNTEKPDLPNFYGLFPFPRMPGIDNSVFHDGIRVVHGAILLGLFAVLIALHLAGVVKHHLIDKDNVLGRILPEAKGGGQGVLTVPRSR